MEHLDQQAVATLKDVMEDDFPLLVHTFLQDSENRIKTLQSLIASPEAEVIRRTAHSFKGSCSNVGAILLASYCADLEKKGLNQQLATLEQDVERIIAEFEHVKGLLTQQLPV
jgi:HPt (histidine-containing phosphotransfer) domain-containing protein